MQAFGVEVVRDFHNHIKPVVTDAKEDLPEWVSIYFNKRSENNFRCNICDLAIETTENSLERLDHIKKSHSEVIELHKNPDSSVGFRIEFLQFNDLNDEDEEEGKTQPVIMGEICEGPTEEVVSAEKVKPDEETDPNVEYVLIPKKTRSRGRPTRKRSWVWKYFDKLSTIIYRCNICNVVLSIKGCNTNNMNRHIRTRHPLIYKSEMRKKDQDSPDLDSDVETPRSIKFDEGDGKKNYDGTLIPSPFDKVVRRSWVWSYFRKMTGTQAQCLLCQRSISHGGNATGNMNRHIKMLHRELFSAVDEKKLPEDTEWVWKVFESDEDDFYSCKICQFKCMKFANMDKSVSCILKHLKIDHGVISGDQIITSMDCEGDE